MAQIKQNYDQQGSDVMFLSRQEAVDLISLLAGQLAQKAIKHNQTGACPEVVVTVADRRYRMAFCLSDSET